MAYLRQRSQDGLPPTIREIGAAVGLKSTSSVHNNLKALENAGLITRDEGKNRAIHLTDETPVTQVPLLGTVTAGQPIYAHEERIATIPFPGDHRRYNELFALRIKGDSMIEAGILDGDIIVCEKTPYAGNGDIIVALVDDEATCKRLYREDGYYRLQPENPMYDPIIVEDCEVLGLVIACMRFFS